MASNSSEKPVISEVKFAENSDFRAEIEKSRAMIEGADVAPEPGKKRVGRPSKAEKEAEIAAQKAVQEKEFAQAVPPEGLREMVRLPFHLAALKTGFQGFQLTDDEAAAIAPPLHAVLITYAPQVSGENLALMSLAGALFSIGIGKYMAFLEFRKQGAAEAANSPPEPSTSAAPAPDTAFPTLHIHAPA